MSRKHPNNGPSFSKAPSKKVVRPVPPSPDQVAVEFEGQTRTAARSKKLHQLLHTNIGGALEVLGLGTETNSKP